MSEENKNELDLSGITVPESTMPVESADGALSDEQAQDIAKEAELRDKYGDDELQTFAESALSSATFGLSDQALVKGARLVGGEKSEQEMKEALRERRRLNPTADTLGEITGVLGPALVSGGASAAAKGASAGFRAATRAGAVGEKLAGSTLKRILKETGEETLARKVLQKSVSQGAGSAVEGAFYTTGELISEEALGNAEFNAENLLASAGTGAVIGGAMGGILGTVTATLPVIKNNRVTDFVEKKVSNLVDKKQAGIKLSGFTPGKVTKLEKSKWGREILENIPNYYTKNLKLSARDSQEQILKKSMAEFENLGTKIGNLTDEVDKLAKETDNIILPTKNKVASTVQRKLDDLIQPLKNNPDEPAKKALKMIEKRKAAWDEWLADPLPITAADLRVLKTDLQATAKWLRPMDDLPINGQMDRKIAEAVREEFLELADNVSTTNKNLGEQLRKANLDYGTAIEVNSNLSKALNKESQSNFLKFRDLLLADVLTDTAGGFGLATAGVVAKRFAESNLKNKLTLLVNVEKANQRVNQQIAGRVKKFFKNPAKAFKPASIKVLGKTQLNLPNPDGSKPSKKRDRQAAFRQIQNNIANMAANPESLASHLSKNQLAAAQAAPNTSAAMIATTTRAIQYLNEVMPRSAAVSGTIQAFQRDYEPSSQELAKFERIVAAVNEPLSILDDLQSNSLTREAVQAVAAVYPSLFARIQNEVMNQIADNPKLTYRKRLQIGVLMDVPADSSLVPENISGLQQSFKDVEQAQTAAVKTTQGGLENISIAEDEKSQSEKIATRE